MERSSRCPVRGVSYAWPALAMLLPLVRNCNQSPLLPENVLRLDESCSVKIPSAIPEYSHRSRGVCNSVRRWQCRFMVANQFSEWWRFFPTNSLRLTARTLPNWSGWLIRCPLRWLRSQGCRNARLRVVLPLSHRASNQSRLLRSDLQHGLPP